MVLLFPGGACISNRLVNLILKGRVPYADMGRILFYLPTVTPWWFENIVVHMIRALTEAAEVHVLVPPLWRNTGILPEQLMGCPSLEKVNWHIADGEAHPSLRTSPTNPEEIVEFVRGIAPDHVVCRSADRDTPRHFPGKVHYLMEGGVAPFPLPPNWVWLADNLFDHGSMPDLARDQASDLSAWLAPAWDQLRASISAPANFLPSSTKEQPVALFLPLEYEHEENFFLIHRQGSTPNARLVSELSESLPGSVHLVLADHPLNRLHVDGSALRRTVANLSERVTLLDESVSSAAAASACDAMIVGDSKSFGLAAFWGKPLCRLSRFRSADWLGAYGNLGELLSDLGSGRARSPQTEDALVWTAYHLANNVFDPEAPECDAGSLIERLTHPVDPNRWAAGMMRADRAMTDLLQ